MCGNRKKEKKAKKPNPPLKTFSGISSHYLPKAYSAAPFKSIY